MLIFYWMKYSKHILTFLFIFSVFVYSDNSLKEYKIELLMFEIKQSNDDEVFSSTLNIPKGDLVNFYNISEESNYSNFSNISEYISHHVEKNSINKKIPFPSILFRNDTSNMKILNKLKEKIIDNGKYQFIDSKSWIQTIPSLESSKYLFYEDKLKNYGFFIKFYQKRFLHIELKTYIGKPDRKMSNINKFIDIERRLFNEEIHMFDHPNFAILISINEV